MSLRYYAFFEQSTLSQEGRGEREREKIVSVSWRGNSTLECGERI